MGYRVKEVREKAGMTQEELSAKSGVSRGTIWALERNQERNTTSKTLRRIAEALGVTVDQLFFAEGV
jgi:transcriptional regulator with XRE-family HTH domain